MAYRYHLSRISVVAFAYSGHRFLDRFDGVPGNNCPFSSHSCIPASFNLFLPGHPRSSNLKSSKHFPV